MVCHLSVLNLICHISDFFVYLLRSFWKATKSAGLKMVLQMRQSSAKITQLRSYSCW